ncbi:MAG: hypothetical protein ACKVZJ_07725 [Phycisphaerales bacterium]
MRSVHRLPVALTALFAGASLASAAPFTVPINPAQSSVTVTLCVQGQCGSDSSPASGFFTIDVDDVDAITSITAYDYNVSLDQPINLLVSFGFLGRLTVNVNGFQTFATTPGVPVGPVAVTPPTGAFSIPGVLSSQAGLFDYNATGVVCSLLQGQLPPIPCTGTGDLSTQPPAANTLNGTITSAARVVSIVSQINQTVPLDPTNPSLGSLTVVGTVRGSLLVPVPPCPGDLNNDGGINVLDLTLFLAQFGTSVPNGTGGDLNADGVVNVIDLTQFLSVFGQTCADH